MTWIVVTPFTTAVSRTGTKVRPRSGFLHIPYEDMKHLLFFSNGDNCFCCPTCRVEYTKELEVTRQTCKVASEGHDGEEDTGKDQHLRLPRKRRKVHCSNSLRNGSENLPVL